MKKLWERVREFVTMERERERLDQIQDLHDRAEQILGEVMDLNRRTQQRALDQLDRELQGEPIAIVVTGGDTNHGEVVRGPVLLIHYEEAENNVQYARNALFLADRYGAPENVLDSLADIVTETHGEPVEPQFMTREARIEELQGSDVIGQSEMRELHWLEEDEKRTPRGYFELQGEED